VSIIRKTIDRTFLLRVSGKGDDKGNENQLEVLAGFAHLPDVKEFRENFDVRMMKASNERGAKLRAQWQRERNLKVLTRTGRRDFLGVSVVVGRSRCIVYASTAGQMDEARGNAFTRHVCEAIADPAFSGTADPDFVAKRDSGYFDDLEHPSLVHAFDPTRFCRSVSAATQMYDAAELHMAAFEARDLQIDPAQGSHMKIMWVFLAYGSEMEAVVGKQRRLVGRLNAVRNGLWPYRPGMTPLGAIAPGDKGTRRLQVDPAHVASVARLATLGLDPRNSDAMILRELGSAPYNVVSTHPSTFGKPVHELHASAVRRLYLRRKLEAYRDGELALEFVGVAENQLRLGSGHVMRRRWEGHDENGEPDRLGSITYRIAMPKPTVAGRDGFARQGWLAGMTDAEERSIWNRLIALRGTDEQGRRSLDELDQEALDANPDLDDADRARLALERVRAQQRLHGGRQGDRVISGICRPYRLPEDGEAGPRYFLRHRGSSTHISELHQEAVAPPVADGGGAAEQLVAPRDVQRVRADCRDGRPCHGCRAAADGHRDCCRGPRAAGVTGPPGARGEGRPASGAS
jgi:hypothetical protein